MAISNTDQLALIFLVSFVIAIFGLSTIIWFYLGKLEDKIDKILKDLKESTDDSTLKND